MGIERLEKQRVVSDAIGDGVTVIIGPESIEPVACLEPAKAVRSEPAPSLTAARKRSPKKEVKSQALLSAEWARSRLAGKAFSSAHVAKRPFPAHAGSAAVPEKPCRPAGPENSQPSPSLPAGWIRVESKSNAGMSYYFHERTGECSWDMPRS